MKPVWKEIWHNRTGKVYDYFYNNSFSYNEDDGTTSIICNVDPHIVGMVSSIVSSNSSNRLRTAIEGKLKTR